MGLINERGEGGLLTVPQQEGLLISGSEVIQTPWHRVLPGMTTSTLQATPGTRGHILRSKLSE